MMYWNGDWSWAAWLAMTVGMLLFWGLVVVAVAMLTRSVTRPAAPVAPDAESVLADRFARGEIDAEEYGHRLETIRAAKGLLD